MVQIFRRQVKDDKGELIFGQDSFRKSVKIVLDKVQTEYKYKNYETCLELMSSVADL